jgi:hypothetical protein
LTIDAIKSTGLSQYYASQGLTEAVLLEAFRSFMRGLAVLRPALYIIESWMRILIALLLVRLVLGSKGYHEVEPFETRQMPWQLDWIMIMGLILWLAGKQWNYDSLYAAGANVLFLMLPIGFYFGLSLLLYIYHRWGSRVWLMGAIIIFTIVLPFHCLLFITVLGIFDPLIDYRSYDKKRRNSA